MEWLLQVVDEIDDAIAAMRHGLIGFTAPIGAAMSSFETALKIRNAPSAALNPERGEIL